MRLAKAQFERALAEARAPLALDDPLARLSRLESILDRVTGIDARETERRLQALEQVLRHQLGAVR